MLASALSISLGIKSPTIEQKKVLFFMLPKEIIGEEISWRLDDTVVEEKIYEFVDENKRKVAERIGRMT